jgi:hypothetical protein
MYILASIPNLQPFVSAAIAAIVALVVVFLSRRSETKKHLESLRTTAYVDFIRGIAGLAVIYRRPIDSQEVFLKGQDLTILVSDAKARIALYGSVRVVSSLAKFLRAGLVLNSPERFKDFTSICQQMRSDTRPRPGAVSDHDVEFLLFGADVEKSQKR